VVTLAEVEPLQIIQNARRRAFIKVLIDLGGEATLREVIRRVAKEIDSPDASAKLIKNIHISMLQTHIPQLKRAGLIEYDRITDTVHLLKFPPKYKYYFEMVEKKDISWSLFYLVFSSAGIAVSLVFLDILALILASFFFFIAIIHTNQTHRIVNGTLTRIKHTLTKYFERDL